jgi:hypothetical protein
MAEMTDRELEDLNRLHRECTIALGEYLKQGTEMCRLLSAIKSHPATPQQRQSLLTQRIKEYESQQAYNSIREALFKLAGWE